MAEETLRQIPEYVRRIDEVFGTESPTFNTICPHMGISLLGSYKAEHQVMGSCPSHLSTYDLTRHGMIISGHATQGLPQVTLEARGDEIYATGVMALIYGFGDNEVQPV